MKEDSTLKPSLRELKAKAHGLEPILWIGKAGLTATVVQEAKKQLRKKGLIKIKMLKSSLQDMKKKDLARGIAEKTCSTLVSQTGFTAVLYRPYRQKKNPASKS